MSHAVVQDDVGAGSHDILPQGHESHMQQDPVTNDEQLESVLARMQNLYTALGPESLIGRATLAAQRMIRLNLQPLQAERQKAHDEKAAAMLLGFCLDEISSVIKRIAEHQDPGVVSDEVCVTTVTKEENERWRYEVKRIQQLCRTHASLCFASGLHLICLERYLTTCQGSC